MHAEDQHAQKGMLSATYQKLYDPKCPAAEAVKNMKEYGQLKPSSIHLWWAPCWQLILTIFTV